MQHKLIQVSAATDRPVRRSASGPLCCTQMSTVIVINWCPRRHHFSTLTIQLSWQHLRKISRSRDMVGAHQNLNVSRDLTMPLSGMVCCSFASTCYRKLAYYQIWSVYLHSLR